MGFKKFSTLLCIRFALVLITLLILAVLLDKPGYRVTSLLVIVILIAQIVDCLRYISKTNAELARFFEAASHADFSQRFDLNSLGAGFDHLGKVFEDILGRFQTARAEDQQELRHLKELVEHVPIPLVSIFSCGKITLWNNKARRLFGSHRVSDIADLQQFSQDFAVQMTSLKPGESRLVNFPIDGIEQKMTITSTQIVMEGRSEMLISLQNIQNELDKVQLQAWQDLVWVLTHEIMNSITPVASLAKTAVDLVNDLKINSVDNPQNLAALDDIADAVTTVARRSDGLTHFVSSYRRLTRLPEPTKKTVKISTLFQQVAHLATQHWEQKNITFTTTVQPAQLDICADINMLEQLLINLLQNAEQALEKAEQRQVNLCAYLNQRGHVVITVGDSGSGVPKDIAEKIFVPFFTTKKEGSGVGLALTRQMMILHGGSVTLLQSELGGAQFNLTF